MITAFHGIGAYRGQRNPLALKRQLDTALSGVELCVADRPIGAFGAVLLGDCTGHFSRDAWSTITDSGRIAEHEWAQLQTPTTQRGYETSCMGVLESALYDRHYCESWMTPVALRALWVKPWAPAATTKAANILAKHRKVPLLTISGKTRIWDLLETHHLPFYWRTQCA